MEKYGAAKKEDMTEKYRTNEELTLETSALKFTTDSDQLLLSNLLGIISNFVYSSLTRRQLHHGFLKNYLLCQQY